ncbi:putative Ig domain-containing protein [Yinghuangia soli]|uniref:Ig domain-containing protein n=1 Tax=Yinghuangia soli TaxID=2908204 RepID=A0AA41PTJ4_9ACTN|nr:putative Ig domain-containing protein [Yinghuangia soli]MCF2525619.1 putative Ig domain-containing protein [Yinghuangia soli]
MLRRARRSIFAKATAIAAGTAAVATAGIVALTAGSAGAATLPNYDHVVIVVHENTNYEDIAGNTREVPYINTLIAGGASFTNFHGEVHPSQGNYFAMFSGATQGATSDACPEPGSPYSADNLAKQLIDKGKTFGSYNEDWDGNPATCTTAKYARKHNPWFAFSNVPTSTAKKMTDFPTDYNQLPTVSFVVPNLCNDMHDFGCRTTGDTWTKNKLSGYAEWAKSNNSLLIVTFDEDAFRSQNQIATVFYGAHVKQGTYGTNYNHYNMLRTLQDMYGLRTSGQSTNVPAITEVWNTTTPTPPVVANPGPQASSVGQAVNVPLQVSGGTAPYTCTFTGLPAGLSNPGGGCTVQGTPTTAGSSNVSVTAKDASNTNSAAVSFTWTVTGGGNTVPSIVNPGGQSSTRNQPVDLQLQVSGSPTPTCTASGLPTGLSISAACRVTGTPTVLGDSSATVTATNSQGSDSETFLWSVTDGPGNTAPTVTSPGAQSTQVGTAVNLQVQRTGTPAPTCTASGLPAGLAINSGCLITGTPTTAGSSNVTVTATNAAGSASATFAWTVTPPQPTGVQLANPGAQSSKFNQKVKLQLVASGGTAPYTCSATGLPSGLWLNPWTCEISGSAWAVGTFTVNATAKDSTGASGSTSFGWTVAWF